MSVTESLVVLGGERGVGTHPANCRDSNRSDLADHRVESKRGHGAPRNSLEAHRRAEEFCWNSPAEGSTCQEEHCEQYTQSVGRNQCRSCRLTEVEQPRHHDKSPVSTRVG
jgi:hypothetical protein